MSDDIAQIARPYAEAAHKHCQEAGKDVPQRWDGMLAALAEAVAQPEMESALTDPRVSLAKHTEIVEGVVKEIVKKEKDQADAFSNFVHQLLENDRLEAAGEIARRFTVLKRRAEGVLDVEIRTALELDKKRIEAISEKLKKKFSAERVETTVVIDESLSGGAMLIAGDDVIDGSVQAELERLHVALQRS